MTKKPRLFYFEEGTGYWEPAPDGISNILEADQLDAGQEQTIRFRRVDMDDDVFRALGETPQPMPVDLSESECR